MGSFRGGGDAGGRSARGTRRPKGANPIFENKTGSISPLPTAKVQRCISLKIFKNQTKQKKIKTYDLHLCTLLFLQCRSPQMQNGHLCLQIVQMQNTNIHTTKIKTQTFFVIVSVNIQTAIWLQALQYTHHSFRRCCLQAKP